MSVDVMHQTTMTMEETLRLMTLVQYISAFGSITDQNPRKYEDGKEMPNPTFKKRVPFKLWKRQREACEAMEEAQVILLPKSRQKGYSEIAAERCLFTLFKYENTKGAVVSKSEDFAKSFLQLRILPKYNELVKNFPEGTFPKIVKQTKEEIEFEGGRTLKSISCSSTGAASLTLDFMVFDEAGGIDENKGATGENSLFKSILNNSLPALDQNPESWIMIIGTSVPGTYYNDLVAEAYNKEQKGEYTEFKYFFIGWHHQPGRDARWYNAQRDRLKDDVYLQHPTDMDDFFYIKAGLVFQHFDPMFTKDTNTGKSVGGRHVFDFEVGGKFRRKVHGKVTNYFCSWSQGFITSYDHGTNHPAVNLYGLYDQYSDMLYIIGETFFESGHGMDVSDIADAIKLKHREFPKLPEKRIADGAIFNDIGVESVGTRFRKLGLSFKKAKKKDEAASRDLVSNRFRSNKILIHHTCTHLIKQLRDYRWDPKSKGEKPIQKDDDAIDALRYMCADCKPEDYERPYSSPESGYPSDSVGGGYSRMVEEREVNEHSWQGY
ncbi:MAG: hypothetical protein GY861_12030 [bacterium]|nr:hypothetical protein [bacterium]